MAEATKSLTAAVPPPMATGLRGWYQRRKVDSGRPVWMEEPGPLMKMGKALTLLVIVIVMLFPMVYVLSMSLTSAEDAARGGLILWPQNPTLDAYRAILSGGVVQRALQVSLLLTLFGTAAQMFFTTTMAYGLSRMTVIGSKPVLYLVLGAMIFSPGMIPSYLLVKELGLLNSYAALILPGLISAWNLIIVRNFFMNIPRELLDAARIDGANDMQIFYQIVLPLSKAVLAVVALFYGVAIWNLFFNAIIYLNDTAKWPIQLVLRQYVLMGTNLASAEGLQSGAAPPPRGDDQDGDCGGCHGADPARLSVPAEVFHQGCADRFDQGLIARPRPDDQRRCSTITRASDKRGTDAATSVPPVRRYPEGIIVTESYKEQLVNSAFKRRVNRRTSLKVGAGVAAAAVAGPRITFAQDASPAVSGDVVASGIEGVPDVYLKFPEPQVTYDGVPGKGGTVRAFTISYNPPPTPRDDNQYWQELERRLGVTWEIDITPQPNYGEKSAVYLAGGDIPDLFYINPGQNASQQYQAMAQGAFLDLTPYVTGDALQQFQNLSNFPQYMWDNLKFQGKTFGIPRPAGRAAGQPFYRTDWAERVGIDPSDPEQLMQMLAAFSSGDPNGDGSANTWGQGRFNSGWWVFDNRITQQATRSPNNWRLNDDGTLTYVIETDEYRQALEMQIRMFQDGAYHPDAASMTFSDSQNAFIAGDTGLHYEGTTSFFGTNNVGYRQQQANPDARITNVPIIAVDGGPGVTHNGTGTFGMVGIPASLGGDEERVLELLHILDYLAAPFGSEENLFLGSGIEGVHWEYNDAGAPVVNEKQREERGDLVYLMAGTEVLFYPDEPEVGLQVQDVLKQSVSVGIEDPTLVLYSQTNIDQGPILNQLGMDLITPIVTGRGSIDDLQAAIDQWKSQGGDQIRNEFQEALQG